MNKFQHVVRWLISRATNLTPSVVYYPEDWPARINGNAIKIVAKRDNGQTPLTLSAMAVCCAMHEYLKVGDVATINLSGVSQGDEGVGDFVVTLERVG